MTDIRPPARRAGAPPRKTPGCAAIPAACLILLLLAAAPAARAGVYSYTDPDGTIHITDRPDTDRARLILPTLKHTRDFCGPVGTGRQTVQLVAEPARTLGLSRPLLQAIIRTESNFNPRAVSPKGARGLMQLMPDTWKAYGVTDPFDPRQNVAAGAAYFRDMMARFRNLDLALAAYNAGPGAVEKYGGVPPYPETRRYIAMVRWYADYYGGRADLVELPGAAAYFESGRRALNRGSLKDAAAHFRKVARAYPKSPEASYNLALVYQRTGRMDLAIGQYRRALALNPYFREAYYNLALAFESLAKYPQAIAVWRRYLELEAKEEEREKARLFIEELQHLARRKP